MASVTRVQEAAEAVCGALHRFGWRMIGETDAGASTWLLRGTKPHIVKIEVQRSRLADYLIINVEWPVLTNPPHKGRQTISVNCGHEVRDSEIRAATERIVVKCIEINNDVMSEEGVASTTRGRDNAASTDD